MEGTRPLTGPALPNLINAVKMFKINFFISAIANLFISAQAKTAERGGRPGTVRPYGMALANAEINKLC